MSTTIADFDKLDRYFKLANAFAMSGWLVLFTLPNWAYTGDFVLYVSFILVAVLYVFLLQKAMRNPAGKNKAEVSEENESKDKPGFSNLRGVLALLRNPLGGLTAWVHILAFDLMMGLYIHHEGAKADISHWFLLPCYFFTLMFGPVGILMFLALRYFLQI
jgi:hypothetical protein